MPNDVNNLDTEDLGLKAIFGERFHDETAEKPTAGAEKQATASTTRTEKAAQKPTQKPTNAKEAIPAEAFAPAKPEQNWLDNLKACAKWAGLFGGLSLLVFYWKEAGLMAESIAVPCIAVCTALAGWGVGRNAAKGCR